MLYKYAFLFLRRLPSRRLWLLPMWQTSLANLLGSLAIHTVGDPHASWGHPRTWQLVPSDPQTTTLPSGGFLQSWRQQTSCEGTISDFGPRHDSHDHFRVTTVRTPVAGSPPTFCAGWWIGNSGWMNGGLLVRKVWKRISMDLVCIYM